LAGGLPDEDVLRNMIAGKVNEEISQAKSVLQKKNEALSF